MINVTGEFSFLLRPAKYGIGVFAAHGIRRGTYLRMFGKRNTPEARERLRWKRDVPETFRVYCLNRGNRVICPKDFSCMPIGWYLNHSKLPNAICDGRYRWYAARNIKKGEEITIDYNSLGEQEESKEDFYFS